MTILVTGSSGYIGSHILVELFNNHYQVICIDSGINSYTTRTYKNIGKICNKNRISRYSFDISKEIKKLEDVFNTHRIEYCIHLASLKSVSESIKKPMEYYKNNVIGTMNILECCKKYGVKGIIFSSSATVYSPNQKMPLTEEDKTGENLTNPYAKTKFFCEEIIKDFTIANKPFKSTILRYFNPIGSHKSGLLEERSKNDAQNLMPKVLNLLSSQDLEQKFEIYGGDYDTKDGTCIRDFINVEDVATAHIKALKKMTINTTKGINIYNVGTGKGTSVLDIIKYLNIPYELKDRRNGDLPIVYCDNNKIKKELMWKPKYTLENTLNIYK